MLKRMGTPRVRLFRFVLTLGLTLPFIMATDECPDGEQAQAAAVVITRFVDENTAGIQITEALRIHRHPELLVTGTVVRPYSLIATPAPQDIRTCEGSQGCRLFFIDSDHWAHFAHPTVTVLWDPGAEQPNERVKWVAGGWWPLVNEEPIFDTVRKREDWDDPTDPDPVTTIVYPDDLVRLSRASDQPDISVYRARSTSPSPVSVPVFSLPAPCPVWAVLVAGYDDEGDTFDTDISGMETVLRGHGVPPRQIFALSPRYVGASATTALGDTTRRPATRANVKDVLTSELGTAIESTVGGCGDFLLFFSSHGDATGSNGSLECEGGPILDHELASWLSLVPCKKVTVVIEACHSGSFINELAPVPATPITLPGGSVVNQVKRLLITSTTLLGRSKRDVDKLEGKVDWNPGDLGSETVWGYIEAFGTSIANTDADPAVSFLDAFEYAKKNDLSVRASGNLPQARPAPVPNENVHICPSLPTPSPLKMSLTQETPTSPAGAGQLLRCRCNLFKAEISYLGSSPPPVATARFFWTDVPNPKWNASSQPHFKEIWDSTRLLPAQDYSHTFVVKWDVGSNIEAGRTITLLAVADSPHSPIRTGVMPISAFLLDNPQASALELEVINPSSCFLFPCGCRTLSCGP